MLVKFQHILFVPILLVARISWYTHPPFSLRPCAVRRGRPEAGACSAPWQGSPGEYLSRRAPCGYGCRCMQSIAFPLNASAKMPYRQAELATLGLHYGWLFGAAFTLLPVGKVRQPPPGIPLSSPAGSVSMHGWVAAGAAVRAGGGAGLWGVAVVCVHHVP